MQQPGATIIVVEDHVATRTFLADNLTADGFELLEAGNAQDALALMARARPDLALVDLGLPDADGLELVRTVRAADRAAGEIDPELPLLILSGRTGELDRLRAFDRGVDDYLAKPFSYPELRMRIAALLRRTAARPGRGRLRAGPLEVDPISRRVELAGRPVVLSKKEFALLRALAEEPTRVYTREELLMGVWGYRASGRTRTLDSHASRLRKKLSIDGNRFVVNVWGVGYRLIDGIIE
ncbi:MAG: response regulator transcription factor, partial [Solirubrobacteraceae bacterium]